MAHTSISQSDGPDGVSRQTDAEEILRQRRLGYSFVRLLPKETGVRPIINLRRRETKVSAGTVSWSWHPDVLTLICALQSGSLPRGTSINQILKTAFQILSYEKVGVKRAVWEYFDLTFGQDHQRGLLGASVFGPHETYKKLKAFKATLTQEYGLDNLYVFLLPTV